VSNGDCAPVGFSVPLFVSGNPVLELPRDTTVCSDQPFPLTAVSNVPGQFLWENGNPDNPFLPEELYVGDNLFQLTYYNLCGDTLYGSVLVQVVDPVRILDILHSQDTTVLYVGTTVTLSADTDPTAELTYLWSTGGSADTTTVRPTEPGSATYQLTVTDSYGCTDSAGITFRVLPSVYGIPNVFTPNGDGTNDVFQVVITGENILVERMDVWNRWGEQVYSAVGGKTGWNGQHREEPASSDVYSYRIEIRLPDGRKQIHTGDVTLLR
jgi:gliding motility-associated-like protein